MRLLNTGLLRTILLASVALAALLASFQFSLQSARAATSDALSGYAWSDNIGWMSFNCTDTNSCATSNYGVDIAATGNFSGYAWSDNVGWVSFSETAGCPEAGCTTQPKLDKNSGAVSGWAKALSADGNGWDGWIKLSGTVPGGGTYGSTLSGVAFSGYSWGSDVVGWLSWSGPGYGVVKAPTCTNGANNPPACNQCSDGLAYVSPNSCVACSNGGCTGPGGNATNPTGSLVCNNGANNPPSCSAFAPTATLSALPSTIDSGQSSTLTWSSTNATSCTAAGGFSTGGAPSGNASTGALSSTQNYQVTCTGSGGSTNSNIATVTVLEPQVSISASPARLHKGDLSTIVWTASQVKSCTIAGPGLSRTTYPGQQTVSITAQSTYTITCITNGSPATSSVTVNVLPLFQEF